MTTTLLVALVDTDDPSIWQWILAVMLALWAAGIVGGALWLAFDLIRSWLRTRGMRQAEERFWRGVWPIFGLTHDNPDVLLAEKRDRWLRRGWSTAQEIDEFNHGRKDYEQVLNNAVKRFNTIPEFARALVQLVHDELLPHLRIKYPDL